ncbi:MAG: hypothetical protein M1819_005435 [Sarea resinae]|nr:MAG: hypothetical protein M1819_005435 [Sarea resinae]
MEKAKSAVNNFVSKAGHHDTTVHERVAPAVTQENVTRTRHEEATTALDKEVHQDHYHTSVQPVQARETLPEEHTHNLVPVEHRHVEHGNDAQVKSRLEQEAAQFKDTRTVGDVHQTSAAAPTIAGEHVHHHVHETIQPVVQKETIQPNVIHTTVPIHEVHHNEAKHHSASALPAVSLADFKKSGGSLTGREERYDGFEGEPRSVGSALNGGASTGTAGNKYSSSTGNDGITGNQYSNTTGNDGTTRTKGAAAAGPHGSSLLNKIDPRVDSDRDGKRGMLD